MSETPAQPWWIAEGLSVAGGWHPLAGRVRAGDVADNEEELYDWEYTEERVLRLKSLGITLVVGQLDRGLGETDQREEADRARGLATLCHRHGLRHGVYIANTIYFESVLKDHPDCEDWVVHTYDGRFSHYGGEQSWRWVGCFNSPGWRERTRRQVERAIRYVGTDLLHFDNLGVWPEPDSCHCRHCQAKFREFLRRRYPTPEEQTARFGYPGFDTFCAPNFYLRFTQPWDLDRFRNPLMQEWIEFRVETVTDYIRDMAAYGRSLRPDIAVLCNGQCIRGGNQALIHGTDPTAQALCVDLVWDECPDLRPDPDPDAPPRSTLKMRGRNLLRRLGKSHVSAYHDEEELAVNLAFAGSPGINAYWGYAEPRKMVLREAQPGVMPLLGMWGRNKGLYCGARPLARTAVWRSQRSLAWISFDTALSCAVIEHVLFKRRIPFSIVQDEFIAPDGLAAFDLLIVPNVEFLSDERVQTLHDYVEGGGSLLITERTGAYDGRARRRGEPAFARMFASDLCASSARREEAITFDPHRQFASRDSAGASATARFGRGRAAYLPAIRFRYAPRAFKSGYNVHYDGIDCRYWKDPWNADELLGLIEWLKPDFAPVRLVGQPEARMDWLRFRDGDEGVSIVRCGDLAGPANLRFLVRADAQPRDTRLYRPGDETPLALEWTACAGGQETVLPAVLRHAVVKYRPAR